MGELRPWRPTSSLLSRQARSRGIRRRGPEEPGGGWLGPSGEWWPCPDLLHQETARRIARERGLAIGNADPADWLERHGWCHVMDDGTVLTHDVADRLTQAQLNRIWDLARAHPSMRDRLLAALAWQRHLSEAG